MMEQAEFRINRSRTISKVELMACLLIILFTLQNWLDNVSGVFSYIDELPALFAVAHYLLTFRARKHNHAITKEEKVYSRCLVGFAITGLIGNILYRYQPVSLVAIDLLTNIKFFLSMYLASNVMKRDLKHYRKIPRLIRIITIVNVTLFIIDRVVNIFPSEYRHGIKSAVLYFDHPTYLAGICAFFAAILSYYGIKRNKYYILANLILLAFTLRGKALASVACYVALYVVIIRLHSKLKLWQIVVLVAVVVGVAWSQIYFYFIALQGESARSVMLLTSLKVMKDYFPIGTGFATFASHSASVIYSPVYIKYGFREVYELSGLANATSFFDDHFWPIIFGQTGVIGTLFYVGVLIILYRKIQKMKRFNRQSYFTAMFVFLYLLISSMAEPAFNNSISIPFALLLGCIFTEFKRSENINSIMMFGVRK